MALTVVITYDIGEDRRRARVAALLQACGDRVQRSVFICTLGSDELAGLLDRIRGTIDLDTDSVHVFRQCHGCWEDTAMIGQAKPNDRRLYWAVL